MRDKDKLQRVMDLATEAHTLLREVLDDRECYAEERSEGWSGTVGGERFEDVTSELEEAHTELESAEARIEDVLSR